MHRFKTLLATPRWHRATLWLTSLLLGATLAVATGCGGGGGSTGPDNDSITGTYVLQRVDEEPLPAEIHHGPYFDAESGTFFNLFIFTVTGGSIRLLDDGRFTWDLTVFVNGDGQGGAGAISFGGWYERDGDEISLEADDEMWGSATVTLDGNTLVLAEDVMNKGVSRDFIYER
jgi:hypothetical protein